MTKDFPLWNIDSRKIGVAIGDNDAQLYNWNLGTWETTGNAVYGVHIKPMESPYPTESLCGAFTYLTIPNNVVAAASGPCLLMFDISNTGSPIPCDVLGSPFIVIGPYPTRSSFGFR